jgi:pyruvate/2-oxoacid:ferredoxin oxidoreductase alpha subunit
VIHAFRVAERLLLPVMVNLDAFYVSHALEPVLVPEQDLVDAYLPPYAPLHRLDTEKVESWGNVVTPDMFYRHRQALGAAMDAVPTAALDADREWSELTGRSYGLIERYRCEGGPNRHRGDGRMRHGATRSMPCAMRVWRSAC